MSGKEVLADMYKVDDVEIGKYLSKENIEEI